MPFGQRRQALESRLRDVGDELRLRQDVDVLHVHSVALHDQEVASRPCDAGELRQHAAVDVVRKVLSHVQAGDEVEERVEAVDTKVDVRGVTLPNGEPISDGIGRSRGLHETPGEIERPDVELRVTLGEPERGLAVHAGHFETAGGRRESDEAIKAVAHFHESLAISLGFPEVQVVAADGRELVVIPLLVEFLRVGEPVSAAVDGELNRVPDPPY